MRTQIGMRLSSVIIGCKLTPHAYIPIPENWLARLSGENYTQIRQVIRVLDAL